MSTEQERKLYDEFENLFPGYHARHVKEPCPHCMRSILSFWEREKTMSRPFRVRVTTDPGYEEIARYVKRSRRGNLYVDMRESAKQ